MYSHEYIYDTYESNHDARQKRVFVGDVEKLKTAISGGSTNRSDLGEVVLVRKEKMGRWPLKFLA